jgi:hypothetical protein
MFPPCGFKNLLMLHTEGHFGAGFHEYEITQEEFEGFGKV